MRQLFIAVLWLMILASAALGADTPTDQKSVTRCFTFYRITASGSLEIMTDSNTTGVLYYPAEEDTAGKGSYFSYASGDTVQQWCMSADSTDVYKFVVADTDSVVYGFSGIFIQTPTLSEGAVADQRDFADSVFTAAGVTRAFKVGTVGASKLVMDGARTSGYMLQFSDDDSLVAQAPDSTMFAAGTLDPDDFAANPRDRIQFNKSLEVSTDTVYTCVVRPAADGTLDYVRIDAKGSSYGDLHVGEIKFGATAVDSINSDEASFQGYQADQTVTNLLAPEASTWITMSDSAMIFQTRPSGVLCGGKSHGLGPKFGDADSTGYFSISGGNGYYVTYYTDAITSDQESILPIVSNSVSANYVLKGAVGGGATWSNTISVGTLTGTNCTFGTTPANTITANATLSLAALGDTISIAASADSTGRAMTGLTTSHFPLYCTRYQPPGTGAMTAPEALSFEVKAHGGWYTIRTSAAVTNRVYFSIGFGAP